MNKTNLLKRLTDIEWDDFEVKEARTELPKNIWETVSAFSNALREGLVNMLMHADYFSAMHSTIRVFSNRIVFQNPGRFGIDISELPKSAVSHPRNPVIARFFRWAKLAENAGFGFDKMRAWKHKVAFETFVDYSEATFYLRKNSENPTENPTENLSKTQSKIVDLIIQNPQITSEELSQIIGIRADTIRDNIQTLKKLGVVQRIGPDKGGHWKVVKR